MITLLLVAAAMAWLFWPRGTVAPASSIRAAEDLFRVPPQPDAAAPRTAPDTRAAIDSLLAVRDRLVASGPVEEESAKSLDRLWLDLFHTGARK